MTNIDFSLFGFYGPSTDPPTFFRNFFFAHTHRVEHSILYKINPWWIFLVEYLGFYTHFTKGTPYFHMKNTDPPWTSLNYIRFFFKLYFYYRTFNSLQIEPLVNFFGWIFLSGHLFLQASLFLKNWKTRTPHGPPHFFSKYFFCSVPCYKAHISLQNELLMDYFG